ncbi:protein jagged-1-like isoform X2 [Cloeon dipterum]|uniref:protein jagged-1-like isoform X2 n=1 Tax=Cloeon dipterum TaxID=197152 RepID=UPI00321F6F32
MQMMGKHHFANCYQTLCFYLLLLLLMISEHKGVLSSGYFELQVMSMVNLRGELKNGDCCGGGARDRNTDVCPNQCITYFNVCLKEYQSNVTSTGACSFGSVDSPTLGGNSFSFNGHSRSQDRLVLPFTFRWTKSFTLILQAFDKHENASRIAEDRLIEKSTYSGIIEPSTGWHTLTHKGQKATFVYRIRVQCDENYYNVTCTTFCRPRDDKFGHFNCTPAGEKICIEGWDGPNCDVPVCKKGCLHGTCVRPGECICREGWGGDLCNECNPYPGCKQGYCKKPWDCICNVNWGGILCDQDLNYCGTHEPCLNGGTCKNTAPDNYQCACLEGFSGTNCEIVKNPCAVAPCKNKGVCQEANGHFNCTCAAGWTGHTCETNINDCAETVCQNGGTCVDRVNSFQCICRDGWEGTYCQDDRNECDSNPCENDGICQNGDADFVCKCRGVWKGKTCSLRNSHCDQNTCLNGGTCQDMGNTFMCRCAPGFEGSICHIPKSQACQSNPCKNGATCVNVDGGGFKCICKEGFEGNTCEKDTDDCSPMPCHNGGQCVDGVNWYRCECAKGFTGPDCRINIDDCASSPCKNGGTCIDGIGTFECTCPPGMHGQLCEQGDSYDLDCVLDGQYIKPNVSWVDNCNTCMCVGGRIRCTNVWCGPYNCREPSQRCPLTTKCVESHRENCLTPDCHPWGECLSLTSPQPFSKSYPAPADCWPNQAVISSHCARVSLTLDRSKLKSGTSVQSICNELRKIAVTYQTFSGGSDNLYILCELKSGFNNIVEATMSSKPSDLSSEVLAVTEGIKLLSESMRYKLVNASSLSEAIKQINVEIKVDDPPGTYWLIALLCMLILAILVLIVLVLLWQCRARVSPNLSPGVAEHIDLRSSELEKSNNVSYEENLHRCAIVSIIEPSPTGLCNAACNAELTEAGAGVGGGGGGGVCVDDEGIDPSVSNNLNFVKASSARISNQLFKPQNPDVSKNKSPVNVMAHKDFNKPINLRVLPIQRNVQSPTDRQQHQQQQEDVLTVIV